MGISLLQHFATICMFCLTSYNLKWGVWKDERDNLGRSIAGDKSNANKKNRMIVKLFFVLGVTWAAEYLSVFVDSFAAERHRASSSPLGLLVFLVDLFNALQGPVMFVVLCNMSEVVARVKSIVSCSKEAAAVEVEACVASRHS